MHILEILSLIVQVTQNIVHINYSLEFKLNFFKDLIIRFQIFVKLPQKNGDQIDFAWRKNAKFKVPKTSKEKHFCPLNTS